MWHEAQVPQIVGSLHPRTEQWGKMLCCVEHARARKQRAFQPHCVCLYLSTPIKCLWARMFYVNPAKGGERGRGSSAWNARDCPSAAALQDAEAMHYRYGTRSAASVPARSSEPNTP